VAANMTAAGAAIPLGYLATVPIGLVLALALAGFAHVILGDLEECLRELGREREELEWEGRDLDSDSRRPRRSGSGCSAISRRYRACATGRCAHP